MHIARLIRTAGRTGPFWRLTVGEGRGALTFFAPTANAVVGKYKAHRRELRRAAIFAELTRACQEQLP